MQEPLHAIRFPSETDEYRQARNELLQAEMELRRQLEAIAAQRRRLPLGGQVPTDYSRSSGSVSTRAHAAGATSASSPQPTTYNRDYHGEEPDGSQDPIWPLW